MGELFEEMTAKSVIQNPYPGPRPFEQSEEKIFFGRDREVEDLLSLITAHPVVLLYAQSGAGKTSLLNAGLIPLVMKEEEEEFEVLPVARVRGFEPEGIELGTIENIYVFNALMSWAGDEIDPVPFASISLASFLKERERSMDERGMALPRLVIFDQFEELFTFYPERWEEREYLFIEIAEALEADPTLRVLFVIREDYLANLTPYIEHLPERLGTRYRLERLRRAAASSAVEKPLQGTGRSYGSGVSASLVQELLKIHFRDATGEMAEVIGEYVEPVQLQVVCQNLWLNLPPNVTVITSEHLYTFGDVEEALKSFYERAIETAAMGTGVKKEDLCRWFNSELITPAGTRGIVFRGEEQTGMIPNPVVDVLEDQHIIRGEMRAGARWYELTHDRLIEPIRKVNEDFFAKEQQRQLDEERRHAEELQRRADEQSRMAGFFLRLLLLVVILAAAVSFIFIRYDWFKAITTLCVSLFNNVAVIILVAMILSKMKLYEDIINKKFTLKNSLSLIVIMGILSIYGTLSGVRMFGVIANTRNLGPIMAGFLGGPIIGSVAGLVGATHRYILGGWSALPCSLATVLAGLFAGLLYKLNKGKFIGLKKATIFGATFEVFHSLLVVLLGAITFDDALAAQMRATPFRAIALSIGVAVFSYVLSKSRPMKH